MSISAVMDRIQAIEAQVGQLASLSASAAADATAFSTELNSALNATSTTSTTGATFGRAAATGDVSATQQRVIAAAESALGLPYVWGGNSLTTGVDCSGLVQQAFKSVGIELPRLSADQAKSGTAVNSMAEAQPGDLIAWDNSSRNNGADHIAIYLGNGKMIEAPYSGANVRIVDVPSTPDYIRRVIDTGSSTSPVSTTGDSTAAAIRASLGSESIATSRSAYDLQALFAGLT